MFLDFILLSASNYFGTTECVELADSRFMEALNHYLAPSSTVSTSKVHRDYPVADSLFIKIQGSPNSIAEASTTARAILAKHGCTEMRFANGNKEADELWSHRREALIAILSYIEGSTVWTTDVWYVIHHT